MLSCVAYVSNLMNEKLVCGIQQKEVLLDILRLNRSLVTKRICRCSIDFKIACHTSARVWILLLDDDNYMNLTTELYLCAWLDKNTIFSSKACIESPRLGFLFSG